VPYLKDSLLTKNEGIGIVSVIKQGMVHAESEKGGVQAYSVFKLTQRCTNSETSNRI
jgi:hypothetical protein